MATPILYTGKQMLLDYYNKQKNTALTLDDVVFGTPERREEPGALTNSWVRIYPAKGSGLTGAPKIYYDRVHMSYVGSIVVDKGTAIRTHDLLDKINDKYNTVFSPDDVVNELLDPIAIGEIFITLKIKPESVTYYDGDIIHTNRYPDPSTLPQPEIDKMATWSIADSSINAVITNGELTTEVNRSNLTIATLPLSAPKTYFEVKVETNGALIGLARKGASKTNPNGFVMGGDNMSWGLNTATGTFHHNGQSMQYCAPVPSGSTVGVLVDLTSGVLYYQIGSVTYGVAAIGLEQFDDLHPAVCGTGPVTQSKLTANFGQVPMTNTPPYDFRRGVYTVKQTLPGTGTGGYDVPDAGTLFDTYCKGQDLWGVLADGEGGVVTSLLQSGSYTCGAAANIVANLSTNPTEVEIAKGTLAETTFKLDRGLEEPVNFLVSASYEGDANVTYHGALQVRIGASAVNNINGGKITIPAGDTTFIIRTMLTSTYVAKPGDAIKISVVVDPGYAGLITNTEPVVFNVKLLDQSNLPIGTLISTYCNGFTNTGIYADGLGGTYEEVIEGNSETCGYVPFVLRTVRVTGTGTLQLPLGVDSVTVAGQGSEGTYSSYKLGGAPGKGMMKVDKFNFIHPTAAIDYNRVTEIEDYVYFYTGTHPVYRSKDFVNFESVENILLPPIKIGDWIFTCISKIDEQDSTKIRNDLVRTKDFINFETLVKGKLSLYSSTANKNTSLFSGKYYLRISDEWFAINPAYYEGQTTDLGLRLSRDGISFAPMVHTSGDYVNGNQNEVYIPTSNGIFIFEINDSASQAGEIMFFDKDLIKKSISIPHYVWTYCSIQNNLFAYEFYNPAWSTEYLKTYSQRRTRISEDGTVTQLTSTVDEGFIVLECFSSSSSVFLLCMEFDKANGLKGNVYIRKSLDGITSYPIDTSIFPQAILKDVLIGYPISTQYDPNTTPSNLVYTSTDGERWTYRGNPNNQILDKLKPSDYRSIDKYTFGFSRDIKNISIKLVVLLDNVPEIYRSETAAYGNYSSAKIGNSTKLFQRGQYGVLPAISTNVFAVDPAIQHVLEYSCAGKTVMDVSFIARKVNFPLAGSVLNETCVGFNKVQTQATGNNTSIQVVIDENSLDCEYAYDFKREIRLSGNSSISIPKGTTEITVKGSGGKLKPVSYKTAENDDDFHFEFLPENKNAIRNGFFPATVEFKGIYYRSQGQTLYYSTDEINWFDKNFDPQFPANAADNYTKTAELLAVEVVNNKLIVYYMLRYNSDTKELKVFTSTDNFQFTLIYSLVRASSFGISLLARGTKSSVYSLDLYNLGIGNYQLLYSNDDYQTMTAASNRIDDIANDKYVYSVFPYAGASLSTGVRYFIITNAQIRKISDNSLLYPNKTIRCLVKIEDDNTFRIIDPSNGFRSLDRADAEYSVDNLEVHCINDNKYVHYYRAGASEEIHVNISTDFITWTTVPYVGHPDYPNGLEAVLPSSYLVSYLDKLVTIPTNGVFYYTTDGINFSKGTVPVTFRGNSSLFKMQKNKLVFLTAEKRAIFEVKPVKFGDTIIAEYEIPGEDTSFAAGEAFGTFKASATVDPAAVETRTITLDPIKKYELVYDVGQDGTLTLEYMGVDENIPAPGTLIRNGCDSFTKYSILADGRGGEYRVNLEYNSADCGYVAPVVLARLYGKETLNIVEGNESTELYYITPKLDEAIAFRVDLSIGQQTLNGITFSYSKNETSGFVSFTDSFEVTLQPEETTFYIRVITTDNVLETNAADFSFNFTPTLNSARIAPGSHTATRVIVTDKEYEAKPTTFGLSNVVSNEAAVTTDGVTGYTDDTVMMMTNYAVDVRKYYFEMDYRSGVESIGFVDTSGPTSDTNGNIYPGSNANSWGVSSQYTYHNGVATDNGFVWGDQTVGISIDGSTGAVHLYLDGVDQGLVFTAVKTSELRFAVGCRDTVNPASFSFNFGQRAMKFPQPGFINGFGQMYLKGTAPVQVPPSQGYVTPTSLNPDTVGLGGSIYGGGYVVQVNEYSNARTLIPMGIGESYWEVWPLNEQNGVVGICSSSHPFSSGNIDVAYLGSNSYSWGISSDGSMKYHNGVASPTGFAARPKNIPISFRYIKADKRLYVDLGNGFQTLFWDIELDVYPAVSAKSTNVDKAAFFVNFGQTAFTRTLYDPSWRGVGTPTRNPFYGTPLSQGCQGFDYGTFYADGNGGQYFSTDITNAEQCGYVIASQYFESNNLTMLSFTDGDAIQVNASFQPGPYTVQSKKDLNGMNYYFEIDTGKYSNELSVGVGSVSGTGEPTTNSILLAMHTGEIYANGAAPDTRLVADYNTKMNGGVIGFYYEGGGDKTLTLYFKDETTVKLPFVIDEEQGPVKILISTGLNEVYNTMINQGQYEYAYMPPPETFSPADGLSEASVDWIDNYSGRIIIADKTNSSSISTYVGKHTLMSSSILNANKYHWTFYIPSNTNRPLVGIGKDGLVTGGLDLKTAMGVTVIDTSNGDIYCDGVKTSIDPTEWQDTIAPSGLALLYDGVARTLKLYTTNRTMVDLPHPAGQDSMRILLGTTSYEEGLEYMAFNIGRDNSYMVIPPGYGTVINPRYANEASLYWEGNRLTSKIHTYGYNEVLIGSDPGFESMVGKTSINTGLSYWEMEHHPLDTSTMIGVADASLPSTTLPGAIGSKSIAIDMATGNVYRSDGTVINTLVSRYETDIMQRVTGFLYDSATNVFSVVLNGSEKFDFPLTEALTDPRVVIATGSATAGIGDAKVNLGQTDYYYGLYNGASAIEAYVPPPESDGGGGF